MPALLTQDLSKTYANGVKALNGIDLTIDQGDFFALLGPNGAGKSTLIGIVSTLVRPTGGDVQVFGHSVTSNREAALANIGLVPQEVNFNQFEKPFDICVNQAGFYGIPRSVAGERAERYLTELKLWDKKDEPSRSLSGGMKRRLMIARAMMNEPALLILDEPTAGVDIEIRRSMWQFVRGINEAGTTILLTTHYLEEAEELCRNIAIIDHGEIIEKTSVRELVSRLDIETFVLDLDEPLAQFPQLEGIEFARRDDDSIEVTLPKNRRLNGVFEALTASNVGVVSMRNKANRLEELFVRLTGN